MYQAKVYKVMIASPSDVAKERQLIRDAIHEWNVVHSDDRKIVLMPVGWESHSSPEVGDRPQAIINKQILADADLLIAVFWTRLGSPTGKASSGTVEEIEEHIKAKKPAMIYFSSMPVLLESIDKKQYAALLKFKAHLKQRGLYESYESLSEFREKLSRQLAQTVINFFRQEGPKADAQEVVAPARPKAPKLSEAARTLLIEASQDESGTILKLRSSAGLTIQANGKNLVESQDARNVARWHAALDELLESGLIQDRGYKGEVFAVTAKGFEIVDILRDQK